MSDLTKLPFNIRVEKAKNELRYGVNSISAKYAIPGEVIALILESILAAENQQRISLICEQVITTEEDKQGEDAKGE